MDDLARCRAPGVRRAARLSSMMVSCGVPPTLVSHNALAAAWANRGDVHAVEVVLSRAVAAGCALDHYSYGALLQACTRHRDAVYGRARAREHVEALLRSEVSE